MPRLRRLVAVVGLAGLIAVSTSGCIVTGRRGCGPVIRPLFHCFDACVRVCR